jgi:replicative DNA helicase
MRINQQNSLPRVQEGLESNNSNQSVTTNIRPPERDLFEHAKTDNNSLFSSTNNLAQNVMEEIRNEKEMEQTKFQEMDEKTNQTMNTLSELLRIMAQLRSPK